MKGIDLKQIDAAIVGSFGADEFERLLRFDFDIDMSDEVRNVGFKKAVTVFLKKAQDEGWLPNLIAAVARERPRRGDVQEVYRKYAFDHVSDAARADVAKAVTKANQQFFGDRPPVDLQQGGRPVATVPAQEPGLERTLRTDLGFFDAALWGRNYARAVGRVCRVELNDAGGTMGTGFLVGPDAVLTNYHVLESVISGAVPAGGVVCRFDYQTGAEGAPTDGTPVGLLQPAGAARPWLLGFAAYSPGEKAGTPDAPPPAADQLDYALVRLARAVGDEPAPGDAGRRGWVTVPAAQPALAGAPLLLILQHPKTEPLKLAFVTDPRVELKHDGKRVRYAVNTEGGSSGSPVFDKDWKLVALHHYGDPAFFNPKYNQGVPIGLIRAALPPAAVAALGPPADGVRRLEAAAAVAVAVSGELKKGTVSLDQVAAVARTAAGQGLAAPHALQLSDKVRNVFGGKIDEITDRWTKGMESPNQVDWVKATDRMKSDLCALLRQAKAVNGGTLPDDLVQLWVDNGCA